MKAGQMKRAGTEILIFGGTTEGRTVAERLLAQGTRCTVSVATRYGEEVMTPHPLLTVHTGRMDRDGMAGLMRENAFCCVIDATHPHAQAVSREIGAACRETGLPYLRLQRETDPDPGAPAAADPAGPEGSGCIYVCDVEEAGRFLAEVPGQILVTTGSKELGRFARALGDPSRITARVLPAPESLRACEEAGLRGRQIFAMQGPFDTDMNCALIRHADAAWLLTKETGAAGGYPAKIEAAARCGIGAVVIRAPGTGGGETASLTRSGKRCGPEQDSLTFSGNQSDPEADSPSCSVNLSDPEADSQFCSVNLSDPEAVIRAALQYAAAADQNAAAERGGRTISPDGVSAGGQKAAAAETTAAKARETASGGRTLSLVGVGVGAREAATEEAKEAVRSAEVLFGARSVLDVLIKYWPEAGGKTLVPVYESGAVLRHLEEHPEIRGAAVAYSGDSGFYSGTSLMLEALEQRGLRQGIRSGRGRKGSPDASASGTGGPEAGDGLRGGARQADALKDLQVQVCAGISCVSWFAAKAGIPWQDWKILSSHGRSCNVVGQVRRNHRCFLLLSGAEDLRRTGALLRDARERGALPDLLLISGYALSRPEEEIRRYEDPGELTEITREGLYVLFIENDQFRSTPVLPGLGDGSFLRGKAPMTSSEIRALSLCRLGLTPQACLWDVGAGTGSVSVEAALACPEAGIWSIEYKEDALDLLEKNRDKFCLQNMEIVRGRAPEALKALPAPTHVFIGGSGGEIREILLQAFLKNPRARVVANCITSETLAALQAAMDSLEVEDAECIQVSVNREEMLGRYHYLKAGNPVFIISFTGGGTTGKETDCAAEQMRDQ